MKLRCLFAALLLGVLSTATAHAGFSITIAPPPLLVYEQPVCPTEGYLWTPGYWAYDNDANDYYWVNGLWVPPPRIGFLWTPGYWGFVDGFYAFHRGYWGPTVGFYGGINYGYGYGGYGYYGGRWDGRVFRYNTVVTRVNINRVHNVYRDKNVVRNTTQSRTAFNGRGGINARPDAKQSAAASASHVDATAAQTKAVQEARMTRNANRGHGRNRTVSTTPNGRTNTVQRAPRTTRSKPASVNGARSDRAFTRDGFARQDHAGRNRDAFTRSSGRNRSVSAGRGRGPKVTRQARSAQPRGGRPRDEGKRH